MLIVSQKSAVKIDNVQGKNPGDVFKDFQGQVFNDLQEQGKRFKVSDIEETTIGEPLEDRKYAKVDTAKILGQGQTIHQRMQEARDTGSAHDTGLNNPSGKNPGDIFEINTRPFAKAHFATFPPALPEKILKASCPKQVCKKCGKPREPISKATPEYQKILDSKPWRPEEGLERIETSNGSKIKEHFEKKQYRGY